MKLKPYLILVILLLTTWFAQGQGTFFYDQQATNLIEGAINLDSSNQPVGQSFTPSFPSVSFIRLNLFYSDSFNNSGSTLVVNIRSNSITGEILGSSAAVFIPSDFFGTANFLFSSPVAVVPGVTYYFQPVQSGGNVSSFVTDGSYAGGVVFAQGVPIPDRDFWFREGIYNVPEPSTLAVLFTGSAIGVWFARRKPTGKQRM